MLSLRNAADFQLNLVKILKYIPELIGIKEIPLSLLYKFPYA